MSGRLPGAVERRGLEDPAAWPAVVLPPSSWSPSFPRGLDHVVLRSLALDHRLRFGSARELLEAARRAGGGAGGAGDYVETFDAETGAAVARWKSAPGIEAESREARGGPAVHVPPGRGVNRAPPISSLSRRSIRDLATRTAPGVMPSSATPTVSRPSTTAQLASRGSRTIPVGIA